MGEHLMKLGYKLCTDGTENHLILWDLRPAKVTGSKMEKVCDACSITLNKNSIIGDRSAVTPGGVRVGAPALTTRGFVEADFVKVADFMHRAVEIAQDIQKTSGMRLTDFVKGMQNNPAIEALKAEVEAFATSFPMPGFDIKTMRYP